MAGDRATAASRYQTLSNDRAPYLSRGRACAKLTIPALMPPEGSNAASVFPTPNQGIGARGVNNLASKLLLSLLPPNATFYRLSVDDYTLEQMTQQTGMRAEVEKALNKIERAVMGEIESSALRVSMFEGLKQLIVIGNVLLYLPDTGGMRVYSLDRYVVKRDPMGNILEIVTRETLAHDLVPKGIDLPKSSASDKGDKTVDLYTHVKRGPKGWAIYQEINKQIIPESRGTYPLDRNPFIALRMIKVDGEHYGRSYVEEYYGDLKSLENLTGAIVSGSTIAAKVVFFVNPNGTTRMADVASAKSGDVKSGNAADVSVLQTEKQADLRIAESTSNKITERLLFAFLLNSAVQRGGERVTAEEIRYLAGELEDALGGVYSIMTQEFQMPLVLLVMSRMEKQGRIPQLPKGIVKPTITTGLEALGRGHDLTRLNQFISIASQTAALPPEINRGDFMKRVGASLGIDMDGLVLSAEEIAAAQQQEQMRQMAMAAVPEGMGIVRDQLKPEAENG